MHAVRAKGQLTVKKSWLKLIIRSSILSSQRWKLIFPFKLTAELRDYNQSSWTEKWSSTIWSIILSFQKVTFRLCNGQETRILQVQRGARDCPASTENKNQRTQRSYKQIFYTNNSCTQLQKVFLRKFPWPNFNGSIFQTGRRRRFSIIWLVLLQMHRKEQILWSNFISNNFKTAMSIQKTNL